LKKFKSLTNLGQELNNIIIKIIIKQKMSDATVDAAPITRSSKKNNKAGAAATTTTTVTEVPVTTTAATTAKKSIKKKKAKRGQRGLNLVGKPFAGGHGRKKGDKVVSTTAKAGLILPVGRIRRYIKNARWSEYLSKTTPVYMTAVIEYLLAEVLQLAGNAAIGNKKQKITPRHINLAIRNDDELSKLLGGVTISSGGILPNVHAILKKGKKSRRKRPSTATKSTAKKTKSEAKVATA
jgi:histone H2A